MPKGHKKKSKYNSIKLFQVHNGGAYHIQTFAKGKEKISEIIPENSHFFSWTGQTLHRHFL